MLHIAICDDEPAAVSVVAGLLENDLRRRGLEAETVSFTDSRDCRRAVEAGARYDLLLLDVDMPGVDGITLGVELAELLHDTVLIYISSRTDRVFDSFRARPFRFLPKSELDREWPSLMDDVQRELQRRAAARLVFPSGAQTLSLRPEDIVYVEALLKKQVLHTVRENYDITVGFESAVAQLEGLGFIRIHRSYAVNYRFIHSINRTDVELDDGTVLPIGRSKHAAVQQEFHRLVLAVD